MESPRNNTEGLNAAAADAARQKMQIKSFTAWVNLHLKEVKMQVDDLQTDFDDGIKLLRLVEVISEEELGKYNKNPVSKFQKIENLNIPLKFINSFLHEVGIRNSYSAENIIEGNDTLILGMIWSLILRYNVAQVSEGDKTAKEGLLLWAKTKVEEVSGGKVQVNNFHNSWQDGVAFNCLIQAYRPDLVDYKKLKPSNKIVNLNQAFDIAEKDIGIPKLLDANDMVTMRPDEKSVMTYVSFFWKAFAANKRKNMAGERITHVVQREQAYAEMQAQYKEQMEELMTWAKAKTTEFNDSTSINSQAELEMLLRGYVDYSRTEKAAKQQMMLDLEALFSSIKSRLSTLDRDFVPPEELTLAAMETQWEVLTTAESEYEEKLNALLKNLKKVELAIKLFNSKVIKLEDWLEDKEAWLAQSMMPFHKQVEPVALPPPEAVADDAAPADAEPAGERQRPRSRSFIESIASALSLGRPRGSSVTKSESGTPFLKEAMTTAAAKEGISPGSGSPKLKMLPIIARVSSEHAAAFPRSASMVNVLEPIDSIAAVQARLNMFAAYEEELAGRKAALPEMKALIGRIIGLGCPPMRQFSLQNREGTITERFAGVEKQGAEYVEKLNEELIRQQKMDEMRLTFAKRAEALTRWMEASIAMLTEAFAHESIAEAEQQIAELNGFAPIMAEHDAELEQCATFGDEMTEMGITKNAYSRFTLFDLQRFMAEVKRCFEQRQEELQASLDRQKYIEEQKLAFAKAAEMVLVYVREQKQTLEAVAPAINVREEDPASVAHGKQVQAALEEQLTATARDERLAQLKTAQELSDFLLEAAATDNPHTRETVSSLEAQVASLEKVIRDKHTFLVSMISQAQVQVSAEQYEEIKKAHAHFDKSGNGSLNALEFNGAMRAMGFEMGEEEEKLAFERFAVCAEDGAEPSLTLDAFVDLVLAQFKESDTMEALIDAFKVVAGSKDYVMADDLKACIPESETQYLLSNLEPRDDVGLDFLPFSAFVYGKTGNA
uniref:Calmodulin n=1 Tax=Calcidiscus leptoporus TaxID=127549 RepID=A0A7S0JEU1_9EUKA|mmetsp:Transcript_53902/g.124084  ORF Transcript_53902/g.124084 Transcript_53902/m.124084 type:complete len:1006 (+) Transcript_53902:84-3101(+)|eukprot:CAMPEP_0119353132 /NCGR_PEP_ID=MMETSP1334-20130426/2351_1 /TAXON_ID=127549 /ORGANISM="Calcidiscus leptoporus, Strain RCC1130" /LENGTH=1005 /DNA_ID=CAMNT_0007366361 /DNA_START=72 /DNA_END=3089 /DNA_ORIENTATION=-